MSLVSNIIRIGVKDTKFCCPNECSNILYETRLKKVTAFLVYKCLAPVPVPYNV